MGIIFIAQFIFVTFGGVALSVEPLRLKSWIICFTLAIIIIPIDMIRKIMLREKNSI